VDAVIVRVIIDVSPSFIDNDGINPGFVGVFDITADVINKVGLFKRECFENIKTSLMKIIFKTYR
jgi:hypothetical protein